MMWSYPYGGYGGVNPMMMGFMVFFWILVIVGIILLIRWLAMGSRMGHMGMGHMGMGPMGRMHQSHGSALDILDERYAKGDITKEQYDQMKKDISGQGA
jgi:putative membrane protein